MSINGHRWQMTAVNAPLERAALHPEPGPADVVVAIAGCGVCHTDLGYLYDGVRTNHPLPLTLGHEVSGRVVAAGPAAAAWMGKSVIVPAVLPCGECDLCRRGHGTICRAQKMPGNDIEGGFATHIVVPGRGLCEVDASRLDRAGLTLAEVSIVADALTTPYQAVRRAGVTPGSLAIVVGAGGVGGYCVQIASAFGAKVVATSTKPSWRRSRIMAPRSPSTPARRTARRSRPPSARSRKRKASAPPNGSSSNVRAPRRARSWPTASWSTARRCRWSASR